MTPLLQSHQLHLQSTTFLQQETSLNIVSMSSLIHNLFLVQINYKDKQLTNQTRIMHTQKTSNAKKIKNKKTASNISMTYKDCDTML